MSRLPNLLKQLPPSQIVFPHHTSQQPPKTNSRLQKLLKQLPQLQVVLAAPVRPQSATSFPKFSDLSLELQRMIWRHAAMELRDIHIWSPKYHRLPWSGPQLSPLIPGQLLHPGIMHATRESRKEGGRYYTKCLERPRICVGKKNMEYVWRNTVYVNFDVDRIILQDTGSATTLAWDGVNALKLLFKELQGAKHVHVLSDNLHYLDMILKLVNVEKFTVLPILETETEEDMHRALSQRLRFRGFTSSDRFKAWELDIEIEHKRAPEEVGLEPCAADRKIIVNDIDRKTLG